MPRLLNLQEFQVEGPPLLSRMVDRCHRLAREGLESQQLWVETAALLPEVVIRRDPVQAAECLNIVSRFYGNHQFFASSACIDRQDERRSNQAGECQVLA